MLLNNSRCDTSQSFKKEERTTTRHLPFITWCHHAPMMKVTTQGKWSLFKSFSLILSMHINKETNMFELQPYLIQPLIQYVFFFKFVHSTTSLDLIALTK
jgi:hypothetical protein